MRMLRSSIPWCLSVLLIGNATAVPLGKKIEYEGGGTGKVVFSGKSHAEKGMTCTDCHPKIFDMKRNKARMTMSDIRAGKYCGACHDGIKAFKPEQGTCQRCHK